MRRTRRPVSVRFSSELHERLRAVADETGSSLSELVERACRRAYAGPRLRRRLAAARRLGRLALPVGPPSRLARESVPRPEELLPE